MTLSPVQLELDQRLMRAIEKWTKDPELRVSAVRSALTEGANPNARYQGDRGYPDKGSSAVSVAISAGAPQALQALIDAGADLNPSEPGRCALERAMRLSPACALVLLNNGADPNTPCSLGGGPMAQAVIHGRTEIINRLLELGATLGTWREQDRLDTALALHAIVGGQFETLAVLLGEHKDQLPDPALCEPALRQLAMNDEVNEPFFAALLNAARREPGIQSVEELLAAAGSEKRDLVADLAFSWTDKLAEFEDQNGELDEDDLEESSLWDQSDTPLTEWLRFALQRHPSYKLTHAESESAMETISARKNDPQACLALLEALALRRSVAKPAPLASAPSARL